MKGKGFAALLIVCGVLILMSKLSFGMGHLMSYIIPIAMVALGWFSVQQGSKFMGWVLMALGAVILLGKFSGLIGLIIAIAMIGYGVSMLGSKNKKTM